jgi:hypothetical protein
MSRFCSGDQAVSHPMSIEMKKKVRPAVKFPRLNGTV